MVIYNRGKKSVRIFIYRTVKNVIWITKMLWSCYKNMVSFINDVWCLSSIVLNSFSAIHLGKRVVYDYLCFLVYRSSIMKTLLQGITHLLMLSFLCLGKEKQILHTLYYIKRMGLLIWFSNLFFDIVFGSSRIIYPKNDIEHYYQDLADKVSCFVWYWLILFSFCI